MIRKRAIGYSRFSSVAQREESITRQVEKIEEFCERNNLDLVEHYIDEAQSGTNDRRDDFQRMIQDAEFSDWDFVVVYKMDRLSRSVADAMHYKKKLNKLGIRILSVIEDFDESTPEGGFFNLITMGISEFYVKNLAREAFAGLMQNAKRAMHTGGTPPLGFDVNKEKKYIINEEEAKIVRIIFKMTLENHSYAEIARHLNSMEKMTKFGNPFRGNFTDVLSNSKYNAEYVYNRTAKKGVDGTRSHRKSKSEAEIVRIPESLPRIIDKSDFEKIQRLLKKRKNSKFGRGPKSKYLLSGYIRCENCGYSITGHTVYGGRNKSARIVYRCKTQRNEKCITKPINSEYLERYVTERITWFLKLKNAGNITEIINNQLNVLAETIQKDMEELKKNLENIKSEVNYVNERITSTSNGVDRLLTEQVNDLYTLLVQRKLEMKNLEEDHSKIRKVTIDETKKKQRVLRSSKRLTTRQLVSILLAKITQGNDEIRFDFILNELVDIEITRDIKHQVKMNRDLIANNDF